MVISTAFKTSVSSRFVFSILFKIIIKQQAIIDALYSKVHHSEQEIINLKETLEFLSHIVKEATK